MPKIRPTNPHARQLRRDATDVERLLWSALRNRQLNGHKFRFQATVGPFVVDFLCADKRLIVELDGSQHSDNVDAKRTAWLMQDGYQLLRFWNNQVIENLDGVLETIGARLAVLPGVRDASSSYPAGEAGRDSPSPNPLPQAGEG